MIKLNNATLLGSVSLKADPSSTTDDVVVVSKDYIEVTSPDGSKWQIKVDNAGAITATKV